MPLMTLEEYNRREEWETPYLLVLKSGGNYLYYFGEHHSYDPNDSQWSKHKEFWSKFLKDTEGKKRIAFEEGGSRPVEKTKKEAILKYGGMGLLVFEAAKLDIPVYSPEPDTKYEYSILEKEFSREKVQYYYFARVVFQWIWMPEPRPNFETYIIGYLERDRKESGWQDFDFSLENMKRIHERLFKQDFDLTNKDLFYSTTNPFNVVRDEINDVALRSIQIRDEYIVNEIVKYMKDGYSIFAHYGLSHVIIQEPLLRELLQ